MNFISGCPVRSYRPLLSRRFLWALAAVLVWLALRALYDDYLTVHRETTIDALSEGDYRVEGVAEELTLIVERSASASPIRDPRHHGPQGRSKARVKLLGIRPVHGFDEARRVEFAGQARQMMEDRLLGRTVRVRLDRRLWDEDHVFLAYVYLGDHLFNAQLLREGLARLDVRAADAGEVVRELRQAEEAARVARVGCWR